MRTSTKIAAVVFAVLLGMASFFYFAKEEPLRADFTSEAMVPVATYGCFSWGCTGMNPSGMCDDGITVAAKSLQDGLLELRYSKSCKANWGRFTPWNKTVKVYALSGILIFARVTAWNPGELSQGLAHADRSPGMGGSSWSKMVDGKKKACTGVEIYTYSERFRGNSNNMDAPTDWEDKVWHWGPCY